MRVYVINQRKEPLMPTTPQKARKLLKQKKAKVIELKPFTIQLLIATGEAKQDVTLGIDSGYLNIGFSAATAEKELITGEVGLLQGMSERITERVMYRRIRRQRLRYRKPRLDNRKSEEGWLAPCIQHKLDSHIRFIDKLKKLLPVTETIVEVANFDIQKIKNPDISGEKYQQGEQMGFWNLREYILHRDGHKCQNPNCKNKDREPILEIHHIQYKSNGGTDSPNNLITLCNKCHTAANHKQGKFLYEWQTEKPKIRGFKDATFMTIVRWRLVNFIECLHTYGYITKTERIENSMEKTHYNDAFIISGGTVQQRIDTIIFEQVRRNNRSSEKFYDAKYIDSRTFIGNKMKILLASRYFLHPSRNGASQLTRRMAAALAETGHEVRAVCIASLESARLDNPKYPIYKRVQDNIPVYCFPPVEPPYCDARPLPEFRPDPNRSQWARAVLNEWTPDLLHITACSGFYDLIHEAIDRKIPTVATLLDFELLCPHQFLLKGDGSLCNGNPNPKKCRLCLKFNTSLPSRIACRVASFDLGRFALQAVFGNKRADTFDFHRAIQEVLHEQAWLREYIKCFIAPAPVARRIFEAHGVHPDRIIDLVYSLPYEKLEKSEKESVPPGKERGLRIGFIGRPSWEKGFQVVLNAFLMLRFFFIANSDLWLAGNGIDSVKVKEYSPKPDLTRNMIEEKKILLFNHLSDLELRHLAAKLDVCVISSICYECTPLVLLEALAQGTPCIGSDTDGIHHLIKNNKSGQLFPPGDARALAQILQNLISNPKQLQNWEIELPTIQNDKEYSRRLTLLYEKLTKTIS